LVGRSSSSGQFDDSLIREAFLKRVRDALDGAFPIIPAKEPADFEQWITALDAWDRGEPPEPPHCRPSYHSKPLLILIVFRVG
jgi:hypothetical protein